MGDDDASLCKVEYFDTPDGTPEETNWIKRAGRCKVTYPNGHIFEGTFDGERVKQGKGIYTWNKAGEDGEELKQRARFEGEYKDGLRSGVGTMIFPNGDVYEGQWEDNKVKALFLINGHALIILFIDARRRQLYLQEDWRHLQWLLGE